MAMHEYQKQMYKRIGVVVALIVLPVVGFFAGMQYQKQTAVPTAASNGKFAGGSRMMRNRTVGTVKSINNTNITVTDRLSNTDKTYTITSSTTYKNGSSDAQASDVKVGDSVLLTLDSSDNTKVTVVTVNPTFMFRGGGNDAPSTTDGGGNALLQ